MQAIRQIRASRIKKIIFVSSDPKTTIKNFVDLSRPSSATFFGDPFMPVRQVVPARAYFIDFVSLISSSRGQLSYDRVPNQQEIKF